MRTYEVGDVLIYEDDSEYLVQSIYYHGPDPFHVDVLDLQRDLELMFDDHLIQAWNLAVLPAEQAGLGRVR